jgi:hypothetical protein
MGPRRRDARGTSPLVSRCLVPFSRAPIICIDRALCSPCKNSLKFCCYRAPAPLSKTHHGGIDGRDGLRLRDGSKNANDRRLIYSRVIFTRSRYRRRGVSPGRPVRLRGCRKLFCDDAGCKNALGTRGSASNKGPFAARFDQSSRPHLHSPSYGEFVIY